MKIIICSTEKHYNTLAQYADLQHIANMEQFRILQGKVATADLKD